MVFHSKVAQLAGPPASKARMTTRILITLENLNDPCLWANRIHPRTIRQSIKAPDGSAENTNLHERICPCLQTRICEPRLQIGAAPAQRADGFRTSPAQPFGRSGMRLWPNRERELSATTPERTCRRLPDMPSTGRRRCGNLAVESPSARRPTHSGTHRRPNNRGSRPQKAKAVA